MSFFSNRNQYQTIDGDDDTGPMIDNSPPISHHIDVNYQNPARQRQTSLSISKGGHRWDHIENLDQFFNLVYKYHQNHGFLCISLQHLFTLFQFVFVVVFSTFLFECVDYDVLFNNKAIDTQGMNITGKRHIGDAIIYDCPNRFSPIIVFALFAATVILFFQIVYFVYQMRRYKEIQEFYTSVLEIPDSQLCNVTWKTVVRKIIQVQPKIHLSVNQATISEFDIYARILRHKNFVIAMVYEELLPTFLDVPLLGSVPYFPGSMKVNIEILFFKGFWSPWKNHFQLKDDFKDLSNLERLGNELRSKIIYVGLINLVLMPFIFIYQFLFAFFSYADIAKREPGMFGMRKYSNYGREKLRHFNELEHELKLRLNRSYEFAVRYMDQFISPLVEVMAKFFCFLFGSIFGVLVVLTTWDEDVLTFEHVITAVSISAAAVVICRQFIPDENLVLCPDFLMKQIVCNIHYAPESWLKEAQSTEVVVEFGKLFHMRAYALILDIISPILNPFILIFSTSLKAHQIVQFFHDKTRYVPELGDVCSYALMDLKEDGDEKLQQLQDDRAPTAVYPHHVFTPKRTIRGKIELSLLNFATQNPEWKPSPEAAKFIQHIREKTKEIGIGQNLMLHSLKDLERPIVQSFEQSVFGPAVAGNIGASVQQSMLASHLSDSEGGQKPGVLSPLEQSMATSVMGRHFAQPRRVQETNLQAVEMSMNALLLNKLLRTNSQRASAGSNESPQPTGYGSFAPLVDNPATDTLRNMGDLLGNIGESDNEDEKADQLEPMRFAHEQPVDQQAESNIWGIPSQSQFQSRIDGPQSSQFFDHDRI